MERTLTTGREQDAPGILRKAKWIWPNNSMYLLNCYAGFRYDFTMDSVPRSAPLHLSADQSYRLYINGRYVCRGPVRGCQASWPYDVVETAPFLRSGENFIAVEAYNPGISTFSYTHHDRAGLICAAEWENGIRIYSNLKEWKMFRLTGYFPFTARLSCQMSFQEDLDLRRDDRSWLFEKVYRLPEQDKWVRPNELSYGALPWSGMEPRKLPLFDERCRAPRKAVTGGFGVAAASARLPENIAWDFAEKELPSVQWTTAPEFKTNGIWLEGGLPAVKPGAFYAATFDLGEEWLPGTPLIEVENGDAETVIEVHYYHWLPDGKAELLPEPGTGSLVSLAARLHLNGSFVRHEFYQIMGVRHVTLTVRGNRRPLKLRFSWRSALYPMRILGNFASSCDELNQIYRISRHTQQVCALDVFVDTPWREQSQWWGDARIQSKNFFWLTGDDRLFRNGLFLIQSQQGAPDGLFFTNSPTTHAGNILPDFCLTWIASVYDLYFQTGDAAFIPRLLPRIEGILNYFRERKNEAGLIAYDDRFWLFEDWGDLPKKPYPAFLNLLYCCALEFYRKLLRACGRDDSAVSREIALSRQQAAAAFFDPRTRLMMPVVDENGERRGIPIVHDQVWCILLDLLPEAHETMIRERILPCLNGTLKEGAAPGPFWATYLLDAAQKLNLRKEAVGYIRRGWRHMIPTGTTWEVFDRQGYSGWSYSHAWSAHPVTHLPELLCGVTQLEPGWRRIRFAPFFMEGETFASVTVPTPRGILTAKWEKTGSHCRCSLAMPPGMSAEAVIGKKTSEIAQTSWETVV